MIKSSFFSKILFKNRISLTLIPFLLTYSLTRRYLFYFFNKLSFLEKQDLFYHSINFLNNKKNSIRKDLVEIKFNGSKIKIPHRNGNLNQLGRAFSLMGHDYEVKKCYQFLLNRFNLNVFYDVGANFGQHTILMLSQNVNCFSFEPNNLCHNELKELAAANRFINYELIPKAVGDKKCDGYLSFSKDETWLGKITTNKLNNEKVKIITLDEFVKNNPAPDLIKIDTEGFETNVINGAKDLIKKNKPFIIFESLEGEIEIFKFFTSQKYVVIELEDNKKLTLDQFKCSTGNFLACPISKYIF